MTDMLYAARSRSLQDWGGEVGLTKHLYKVGLGDGTAKDIEHSLNAAQCAGRSDWNVIKCVEAEGFDEADALTRLAAKETLIDPRYYPQIKGERGIVKVKPANVENHFLVQNALAGEHQKAVRVIPLTIAAYLLRAAAG